MEDKKILIELDYEEIAFIREFLIDYDNNSRIQYEIIENLLDKIDYK